MMLWPLVFGPVIFLVVRWAWPNGHGMLGVTRSGFSWLAARVGVATDVQLTSVLAYGPTVLIGFRPTAVFHPSPTDVRETGYDHMLLSPDSDAEATIGRLRRWETSGATVVMWRDRIIGHVEFSHLGTGEQVTLSLIPNPAVTTADGRSAR